MPKRKNNGGDDGKNLTVNNLRHNYRNLYRNMLEHNVPKKVALEKTFVLQQLNDSYRSGSMTKRSYAKHYYEDFYDDLYEDYEYDIDDAYAESE